MPIKVGPQTHPKFDAVYYRTAARIKLPATGFDASWPGLAAV